MTSLTTEQILQTIAQGEMANTVILKTIRKGYKLDNQSIQQLLVNLRDKYQYSYRQLLNILLTFDMVVEDGDLTNNVLDKIRINKKLLDVFQ